MQTASLNAIYDSRQSPPQNPCTIQSLNNSLGDLFVTMPLISAKMPGAEIFPTLLMT